MTLTDLEAMAAACSLTPEQAERFRRALDDLVTGVGAAVAEVARVAEAWGPALRDAGVLPTAAPQDPRDHALWLRQRRGTGPDRQVQHRPRPRRVAGQ